MPLQTQLPRTQCPIQYSSLVCPCNVPVYRQVLIQERQQLQASGRIPPITHEVHDDGKESLKNDAGTLHSAICVVRESLGESATGFGVGKDGVAFGAEGEGEEFGAWFDTRWWFARCGLEGWTILLTDVGGDSSEDDLTFVLSNYRGPEV